MNNEKNTETSEVNAVLSVPDRSVPKSEVKTVSKSERLEEKLKTLCEKREKAFTAQSAAEKRTKEIDEQINNTYFTLKSVQKIEQKFAYMIFAMIFCLHFYVKLV